MSWSGNARKSRCKKGRTFQTSGWSLAKPAPLSVSPDPPITPTRETQAANGADSTFPVPILGLTSPVMAMFKGTFRGVVQSANKKLGGVCRLPDEGDLTTYPLVVSYLGKLESPHPGLIICDGRTLEMGPLPTYPKQSRYRRSFALLYHEDIWYYVKWGGDTKRVITMDCAIPAAQIAEVAQVASGVEDEPPPPLDAADACDPEETSKFVPAWVLGMDLPNYAPVYPIQVHVKARVGVERSWAARQCDHLWSDTNFNPAAVPNKDWAMGEDCLIWPIFEEGLKPVVAHAPIPKITKACKQAFHNHQQTKRVVYSATLGFGQEPPPFHPTGDVVSWYGGVGDAGPDRAHRRYDGPGLWNKLKLWCGNFSVGPGVLVEARDSILKSAPITANTVLYRRIQFGEQGVCTPVVAGCLPLEAIVQLETKTGIYRVNAPTVIQSNGCSYEVASLTLLPKPFRWSVTPVRKMVDVVTYGQCQAALVGSHSSERVSISGKTVDAYQGHENGKALPGDVAAMRLKMTLLQGCAPERLRGPIGDMRSEATCLKDLENFDPMTCVGEVYRLDRAVRAVMGAPMPFSVNLA